ncbi:uncharacterized protein LOC119440990 [Dermacentor silvarum]|uniref:uncharacterized protein LOC119440990 n=1 Tax=Dermacentor silvarum TaxID=543639 RepID=UPI002101B9B0|nr:uncharacterized protein LOC119440990 [Dermacentor silvarum]
MSILEQECWALAVAESALEFEHRLPVVGAVLVRRTRSPRVEFTLRGRLELISSPGYKIRLQGLQMARMTIAIIHRSVTKTIRRWRTRGAVVVSSLLTERSSAEPLVEVRRGSVPPPLSARRGWLQQLSFGSIVITKPEEDRIYTMTDATPWTPLLSLCTEPKPIEFQQIIPNNSKVAAVSCNDSDRELFCLGSCPAEERLVRVLRLRQQDVRWHTTRLTLAREICGLMDNAQNRTSAFFLDARTNLVHDTHPMLLWDARHSHREGPVAGDTTPPEDLQKPEHYLVTEMQPGWRPLTSTR